MRKNRISLTVSALAASVSVSTLALAAPSADEVLSANKAATAASAWDGKAALKLQYDYSGQQMTGKVESLDDLKTGRFADTFTIGPAGGANGYDGTHSWSKDPSGSVTVQDGGDQRAVAVNDGYRRANLWWQPDRGGASISSDGEKSEGDSTYDVLTVTPKGGKNFDAWFDAKTHLLARYVEKIGPQTITTTLSDYRPVDGIQLPYRTVVNNGDAKYDQTVTLTLATFLPAQPDTAYAMPKVTLTDFDIAGGNETTFPFQLINNHIYARTTVNGKPFTFVFDTGGVNLVTPATAAALGLKPEGQMQANGAGAGHMDAGLAKVAALGIGKATIKDQVFVVVPLDALEPAEGTPMPGMVGFETFRRFVTRFDYGNKTITFIKPSAFDPSDAGIAVPFAFNGNTIEIKASYAGVTGNFTVDTGSRASLTLNAPFAAKYNIRGDKGVEAVTGWGVGGPSRAFAMRGKALQIGAFTIDHPVVEVSTDKAGAFSDASLAGNIGAGILKRYVVTLDYEHSTMYLKPGLPIDDLDTFDRSGMWLNADPAGFVVVDVTPTGPAAASGIQKGEVITSVDGATAASLHLFELRQRLRDEAPGTVVTLAVRRGTESRDVKVTLRDLI